MCLPSAHTPGQGEWLLSLCAGLSRIGRRPPGVTCLPLSNSDLRTMQVASSASWSWSFTGGTGLRVNTLLSSRLLPGSLHEARLAGPASMAVCAGERLQCLLHTTSMEQVTPSERSVKQAVFL